MVVIGLLCEAPRDNVGVLLRNRVDPWGDLHAVASRAMFTGNRGCLVDAAGAIARHHRSSLWITCLTEYRGWRHPLTAPGRWTPLFFLDEAVALAAGHRPCGLCRRPAYLSYQAAVTRAAGGGQSLTALDLNRRLAQERLRPGRGVDRAHDRRLWTADIASLPAGTVVVLDGRPRLMLEDRTLTFTFDGWVEPVDRSPSGTITVLTPPTSVAAMANGYPPVIHPGLI
jgi:hypothetical protein